MESGTPGPSPTATVVPVCAAEPEVCRTPVAGQKARLTLRHTSDGAKDKLQWKWSRGSATTKADYGNPMGTDDYVLCLYDGSGLRVSAVAPAGGMCGTRGCWKEQPRGFVYKDREFTPAGLSQVSLKEGVDGKAKIQVKGQGALLALPDLTTLTTPLTVQLHRTGGDACWGAVFSFPPALKNDGMQFVDKAD